MAGVSLLALLDDIATLLDDVALYSKVAAKKTSALVGDDLALNAQQVTGVRAERELPVVWAVAKGSLLNKVILVPVAMLISYFIPWLITPLLMVGGSYLCFEGFEKITHPFLHKKEDDEKHHEELLNAINDEKTDMVAFEKNKIKGAIRTDFILSAEIIVIALGAAQGADIATQAVVVSLVALAMTIGVYSLVAGIVKFDDVGLALIKNTENHALDKIKRNIGHGILFLAPKFMKLLSIVGTAAMFLVGGGILVHGIPMLHHWLEHITHTLASMSELMISMAFNGIVGIIAGAIIVIAVTVFSHLRGVKH